MFSRRLFLASSGAALWLPKLAAAQGGKRHFTLGVASGSPRPNSVILWTRLAPDPLQGGGMPAGTAQVRYRVCSDEMMRNTLQDGVVETSDATGNAIGQPGRRGYHSSQIPGKDATKVGFIMIHVIIRKSCIISLRCVGCH